MPGLNVVPDLNGHNSFIQPPAAIILAGGKSRRFGAAKILQSFLDKPFVVRIVSSLRLCGVKTILLVLGHQAKTHIIHLPDLGNVRIIINEKYQKGQFTSLQAGVQGLGKSEFGSLICLVDQPHILPLTYHALLLQANQHPEKILIPVFGNRGGHPVYIPAWLFPEILATPAIGNLRQVFSNHKEQLFRFQVADSGIVEDIDTPADLKRLETFYSKSCSRQGNE